MSAYQLGLYEKAMPGNLTLEEKLAAAGEAGYDFLELSIDETDEKLARLDWTDSEVCALRRSIEQTGTPIRSICLSGHRRFPLGDPDAATRTRSLAIMEKAVRLAARLGARVIQIAGYDVYYKPGDEATRAYFAENLARSVEIAAAHAVMLAFETMETPFLNTVEKAVSWVDRIRSPYLAVYPDLGNITCAADGDRNRVHADLESGRGHIAALHLKETKPGVFREVPYGSGHVDFAGGIQSAWNLGVRMYTAEFWWTGGVPYDGRAWKTLLHENARFLRGYFPADGASQEPVGLSKK
ncbi:MAG: L-ribulose-5-phosphate 3-epimerase [Spirochaetaceae bacterium]|jgi:predicted hexulose-6-phosphate isomerase|nr:L-ribulose-5-phosphate 3-epimerase [Spirochaetaceae bacterium]